MKRCTKCGVEYPATAEYFHRNKDRNDGLNEQCKHCRCKAGRQYYEQNKRRIGERVCLYHQRNRDTVRKRQLEYRKQNKEKISASYRQWREHNPEKKRESFRRWREENIEKYREYQRQYNKQPKQRLHQAIRGGVQKSLKAGKNGRSWESLVGYTTEDLMRHLESQFKRGMTWDNYGEWHVDHIRPVADFDFDSPEDSEFLECWSLWNLQPLWGTENISKRAKCGNPPLPLLTEGGRES